MHPHRRTFGCVDQPGRTPRACQPPRAHRDITGRSHLDDTSFSWWTESYYGGNYFADEVELRGVGDKCGMGVNRV